MCISKPGVIKYELCKIKEFVYPDTSTRPRPSLGRMEVVDICVEYCKYPNI